MKCVLCHSRKGKRSCPAKGGFICAQCCGEKRILVIDCPETCDYLKVGRSHEVQTQRMRHFYTDDPMQMDKRRRVFTEFEDFFAEVELSFADERRSNRDLIDKEVAEAVDLVLATLRTEEKGILYERVSSDFQVEAVRRRLREIVNGHLNPGEGSGQRMRLSQVIESLEVVRDILESHMRAGPSGMGYVDFLARLMPRASRISGQGSSLIIPG